MRFKDFLEFTAGVPVKQMNPGTLGSQIVNKELGDQMPTKIQRKTGETSVHRSLNHLLGMRPSLPTPEQGPTLKSNLDQKPKKFNTEPRFRQVKPPLGVLNQQSSVG